MKKNIFTFIQHMMGDCDKLALAYDKLALEHGRQVLEHDRLALACDTLALACDRQALEQKYSGCDPPCLLDSSDGR